MATDRQIEANRKNAQKCTGPKSAEGKTTSSQNALKTGLDARSEVLRFESRAEYKALIAAFYDRFQPTIPEDCSLVDMLIRSEWLLRRYTSIETAVWEQGFHKSDEPFLGDTFLKSQEAFERIGRRLNWTQRNYQIALKQLLDIRAARAPESEPETVADGPTPEPPARRPEAAATPPSSRDATEPVNPKLVSFLLRTPQSPALSENTPAANAEPEEYPPTAA